MTILTRYTMSVEVDTATQFATVYDKDGKPAGTLSRRRINAKGPEWTLCNIHGVQVYSGEFISGALRQLYIDMNRREDEMQAAETAALAAEAEAGADNMNHFFQHAVTLQLDGARATERVIRHIDNAAKALAAYGRTSAQYQRATLDARYWAQNAAAKHALSMTYRDAGVSFDKAIRS